MREEVRRVIEEHARLQIDFAEVHDDDDLFRLGMTSHASVTLMLALEATFGVEFPEEMLNRSTFESAGAIQRALDQLAGQHEGNGA